MLVQQGDKRSTRADRRLAWSLAGIAGALNAAGFYAVGLYASNMTGNVSAVADHIGTGVVGPALVPFGLVVLFVLGATVSTLLVGIGQRHRLTGIYAYSVSVEAVLLAGLGCADLWLPEVGKGPLLVFGLSFIMGHQNAVVTQISNARVRTTHVTGMVTDIGIEVANLIMLRWQNRPDTALNSEKLRLHGVTVVSFLVGGIIGVMAYRAIGAFMLFIAAGLLVALAAPGIRASRGFARAILVAAIVMLAVAPAAHAAAGG